MIVNPGDKIHVIARRRFLEDMRRHFVGQVVESSEYIVKADGYVYILESNMNLFVKKPRGQIKIISLTDSNNIITILPAETDLKKVVYKHSEENRMIVTDGGSFCIDVNEFGSKR